MKKSMLLILLVFVFASSSVLAGYPQGVTQKASAAKLQQASKTPLQLVFSSKTNIPRFATFRVKTQSPQSPETSAIEFFEEYKELFKISKASEELSLKNIHVDNLGMTHVKMRQMVQGIPVFGSEMIVHINKNNEIYAVNGEFMPQLEIADVTARLAPGTAIETAKSNIGDAVYRWETDYEKALPEGMSWRPEAELTIVQHEKAYRVAYKTMIATEEPITANWIYFVDAKTGEILNKYNDIKTSDAVGTGNYRLAAAEPPGSDVLLLIGRRHQQDCNSWMHNSVRLTKGRARHQLYMHPDDLTALGISDGGRVTVTSRVGSVTTDVLATDDVMPGVVSLPHGYGHQARGTRLSRAATVEGVSINDLTDAERLDVSGNAALTATPVRVSAAG